MKHAHINPPSETLINYDDMMQANLSRVFGERDAGRRMEAIHDLRRRCRAE